MELKIMESTENALLKRKHVVASLHFPGEKTPSNKDVIAALAKANSAAEDAVALRRIESVFGSTVAKADAYIYADKATLEKIEARPKKKVAAPAPEAS